MTGTARRPVDERLGQYRLQLESVEGREVGNVLEAWSEQRAGHVCEHLMTLRGIGIMRIMRRDYRC